MKFISYTLAALFLLPLILMPAKAAFDDVSLNSGATVRTLVGGETIDMTVVAGKVETLVVADDTTLAITLAAGSVIDLTSAGRKTFSYNKGQATASFDCGSSSSVLTISLGQGLATETVSVTPTVAVCAAAGSTSGGSSTTTTTTTTATTSSTPSTTTTASASPTTTTSTASSATPSTTTTTTASTPATSPVVTTPTPSAAPVVSTPAPVPTPVVSAAPVLMSQLNPGARSDEVMTLQELLAQDPEIYPEGIVSGFYGPKTTVAVKRFQAKYGLPQVGRVGPATLAKINEVLGESGTMAQSPAPSVQAQTTTQIQSQIQAIQQQIQALSGGASVSTPSAVPVSGEFSVALSLGSRNNEVKMLQQALNSDPDTMIAASGVGSSGRETTYFGPATRAAVQKFQVKYGIAGPGNVGYGRVGPATRAKLNELLGGEAEESVMPESPSSAAPMSPPTASAVDVMTKQIEDQIKTIQAQIDALLKR
ncbi:MAG: peptidoglycan-binding protein [Parcubacteria group bacterium]|nr:peptidoglycan-binding protein [Parcubacteria group bacterium]